MEYLICPLCGKETPAVMTHCEHCGEMLPENLAPSASSFNDTRTRSVITTFYLRLGLFINSIMGLAYFATFFTRIGLWSAHDPMSSRIYGFVSSAILFYAFWSLIHWQKRGLYVAILMAVINMVVGFITSDSLSLSMFMPILSVMVLYAVLLIKKDGKSCWKQMKF